MNKLELFLVNVLRAGSVLFFFIGVLVVLYMVREVPPGFRFLVGFLALVSIAMVAGTVAILGRMSDRLDAQGEQLKMLLSANRQSAAALASIDSVVKRVMASRSAGEKPVGVAAKVD